MNAGGNVRNWKKRYFVLSSSTLQYYKTEEDKKPKGSVNLKVARGVRSQSQCKTEWPKDAKNGSCFGIATEGRTYYLYSAETDTADLQ